MSVPAKSLSLTTTAFSFEKHKKSNGRASFPKVATNKTKIDVVDAISIMHQGSSVILLTNENEIDKSKLEFQSVFLSKDNQNVHIGSISRVLFAIRDITNISILDDDTLNNIYNTLNINEGISSVGLSSLMFAITLNNNVQNLFFIGESQRTSYIWFRGLQSLCTNKSNLTIMNTLPLMVSNRLRIGHKDLYISKPQDLILSIQKEYPQISKCINHLYSFASYACILDSSEHLTLLSQAIILKQKSVEIEHYLKIFNENNDNNNTITNEDLANVQELYYFLHSECTAATLKSNNMQNDMFSSRV